MSEAKGQAERSVEEELVAREEIRATGPVGVAYVDHMHEALTRVYEVAQEHGIPLFVVVGLGAGAKDGSAYTLMTRITRDRRGQKFCSAPVRDLFQRLKLVVKDGGVPVPPEFARMIGCGGEPGVCVSPPAAPGDGDEEQARIAERVAEMVATIDPSSMPREVQDRFLEQKGEIPGGCGCAVCRATEALVERIRALRKAGAN